MLAPDAPPPDGDAGEPVVSLTARAGRVDAAASVAGTLAGQAGAFVAGLLVVRQLGAEARGVVALVALTYRQAAVLATLGLEFALLHFGARAPGQLRALGRRALLVAAGQGLVAAAAAWLVLRTLLAGEVAPAGAAVTIAALSAPAFLVMGYGGAVLRASGRLVEAAALEVAAAAGTLAVVVAGVVTDRLWLAVTGAAAGTTLAALLTVVMVRRLPASGEPSSVPRWGALLRYGLAGHLGTIFQNLNYRVDFYLVALLLSTTDVGLYALAVSLAEALLLVPDALGFLVMQRAAASPRAGRATEVTLRLSVGAAVGGGVVLAVGSRWVVPAVFGAGFDVVADAILALLPGVVALAVWKTLVSDLSGRGLPSVRSTSAGVALAVTVVGNLLLIPPFGIVGAAAASSAAYAAAAAVAARRYRSAVGRPLHAVLSGRRPVGSVA